MKKVSGRGLLFALTFATTFAYAVEPTPLDPADIVEAPAKSKWHVKIEPRRTGDAYARSPLFKLDSGQKVYVTPNAWNTDTGGFKSQLTWANSGSDWGVTGENVNDGKVHAYPAVVCGWKTGVGVIAPCVNKPIAALGKLDLKFNWEGPANCGNGANRTNVLVDLYLHDHADPAGGDLPTTNILLQSSIDCDGFYGGHARDGEDLVVGDKTYRIFVNKTGSAKNHAIEVFTGPFNYNWTVGGTKNLSIDYLGLLHALAAKGLVSLSEYVTSVQAGFELLAGGSYRVTAFSIDEASGAGAAKTAAAQPAP